MAAETSQKSGSEASCPACDGAGEVLVETAATGLTVADCGTCDERIATAEPATVSEGFDDRMAELNRAIDSTSQALEALDEMVQALREAADELEAAQQLAGAPKPLVTRMRAVELRCRAAVRTATKTTDFSLFPINGGLAAEAE